MPMLKIETSAFLWLLFMGGLLVMYYAYDSGLEMVRRSENSLANFDAQHLAFDAVSQGLPWLIPVQVGILLAGLSAVIGALEFLKMKRENISEINKKVLVASRLRSVLAVSPILVTLGIGVGLTSAYFETTESNPSGGLSSKDFGIAILKAFIFGTALASLGIGQIAAFFKWPRGEMVIVATLLTIVLGILTVVAIDYGLGKLLW